MYHESKVLGKEMACRSEFFEWAVSGILSATGSKARSTNLVETYASRLPTFWPLLCVVTCILKKCGRSL